MLLLDTVPRYSVGFNFCCCLFEAKCSTSGDIANENRAFLVVDSQRCLAAHLSLPTLGYIIHAIR